MTRFVGHRGLPRQFPDNSLAGILAAKQCCDMAEVDLRRTADHVAVLSHDPTFAGQPIFARTWSELAALRVAGEPLARLDEVLAAMGDFPLNLEIKQELEQPDFDPTFALALEVGRKARPQDLLTCFHWPTITAVRAARPKCPTGLLVREGMLLDEAAQVAQAAGHRVLAVFDPMLGPDPRPIVQRLLEYVVEVVVWTVNDPARARQLAAAGVAAIISDDPLGIRF